MAEYSDEDRDLIEDLRLWNTSHLVCGRAADRLATLLAERKTVVRLVQDAIDNYDGSYAGLQRLRAILAAYGEDQA